MDTLPPVKGTVLKVNVTAELGNNLHLSDVDFEVKMYANKSVDFKKSDLIKVDKDNYIVVVNSNDIGTGEYFVKLTVYIPDADVSNGIRTEVVKIPTGIRITA